MAGNFSGVQRTFPKKTTFSGNPKLKEGKWERGQRKYNKSIFNEDGINCFSNEAEVKSEQQPKNKKTMKAKKRAMHLRKNAGKQSKVEEDDSNTYISAENDEAVAWTSDNDRSRNRRLFFEGSGLSRQWTTDQTAVKELRESSISEKESNIRSGDVQEIERERKDGKSFATNSIAEELDMQSSGDEWKTFVGSRKPSHNVMTSSVSGNEKVISDNTEFREEIAKIPLGKAKQLRERLGKKLFERAFFVEDSSSTANLKSAQKAFVRENPKRPREVSSKKPVSKFRNVFENEKLEQTICDPRFESRCGEFNDYIYHNNYSFLDEIRRQEKKILMKELKNAPEDGAVNRNKLKEALRKMKNHEKTQADVNRRKEVIRELRHENNERMLQGLPPSFKTRAHIRELIWRKKYEELKSGKKLEKYIRRKMKNQDKRRNGIFGSVNHENEPLPFSSV